MVSYEVVLHYAGKEYKFGPIEEDEYSIINLKTDICNHALGEIEGVSTTMISVEGLVPPEYEVKLPLVNDSDLINFYSLMHFSKDKKIHFYVSYDADANGYIPVPPGSPTNIPIQQVQTSQNFGSVLDDIMRSPLRYFMGSPTCTSTRNTKDPAINQDNIPASGNQEANPSAPDCYKNVKSRKRKSRKDDDNPQNPVESIRKTRGKKINFDDIDKELLENETFEWSGEEDNDEEWAPGEGDKESGTESDSDSDADAETESGGGQLSDYQEDEEIANTVNSESEEDTPMARFSDSIKDSAFKLNVDGKIELEVNQTFNNLKLFRKTLSDFAIQEGFELDRVRNEKRRVVARCSVKGCPWRIYAAEMVDGVTYQVRTLTPDHTCQRGKATRYSEATSTWIAEKFAEKIEENPNISIEVLAYKLQKEYGVEFKTNRRFYRAKAKALANAQGDHAGDYDRCYDYVYQVLKTNPGSMVRIRRKDPIPGYLPVFDYFFMSFHAQKMSYLAGCRPFISVDGCHLKGPHGGVLLSAVTVDANRGILPLAAMICDSETNHTWGEFMRHLYDHLGIEDNRIITFMSDRQKGVIDAIHKWFPEASHRFCAFHIFINFKGRYPGNELRTLFWKACRATEKIVFDHVMAEIRGLDVRAHQYLAEIPAHHWSMHGFDENVKCDHVTNNMSESWNASLGLYRGRPILTLCEKIRRKVMTRMNARYEKGVAMKGKVPVKVMKYLDDLWKYARKLKVMVAGNDEFEVEEGTRNFIVDLKNSTCDCRYWSISGLPCKHALASLKYMRKDPVDFVHPYLQIETYLTTYSHMIHPIPDQSKWEQVEHEKVAPPKKYAKRGRRKINRRRGPDEPAPKTVNVAKKLSTKRCEQCKQLGHNKRTCGKVPKRKLRSKAAQAAAAQEAAAQEAAAQVPTATGSQNVSQPTRPVVRLDEPIISQTSLSSGRRVRQRTGESSSQPTQASGDSNAPQTVSPRSKAILAKIRAETSRVSNFQGPI